MTISNEAVEAAAKVMLDKMYDDKTLKVDDEDRDIMRAALEAAAPYMQAGDVEWTVFRASDGENGSPAENVRYSTKAGAQESIDSRYGTPELWEPRSRIVGEWTK